MKIPEEYIHGELGHKERAQARQIEEDYTSDALAWSLVVAFERIATLTEQLEETRNNLRQMTECRDGLNRLVAQREEELAQARAGLLGWIAQNGPGGWIDDLRNERDSLRTRIETLIGITCKRCERGDQLFVEPATGFYTHGLGGNYCDAHNLHSLLDTPQAQAARARRQEKLEKETQ